MWHIRGERAAVYVNADQVCRLVLGDDAESVNLVYASGGWGSFSSSAFLDDTELVRRLYAQFAADPRFTPLRGGRMLVNFDNVLRVLITDEGPTVAVLFPNKEEWSFTGEDITVIRRRLVPPQPDETAPTP